MQINYKIESVYFEELQKAAEPPLGQRAAQHWLQQSYT
jgi:hypothetical protein